MKNKKELQKENVTLDIPVIKVISKRTSAIHEPATKKPKKEPPEEKKEPKPRGNPKWVKGVSQNPTGRRPDPPEVKQMKNLTKLELIDIGNLIINKTPAELQELAEADTTNCLHVMIASVVARIIRTGDMNLLDTLLNRLIGKVREEFIGSIAGGSGSVSVGGRVLIALPSNGKEVKPA